MFPLARTMTNLATGGAVGIVRCASGFWDTGAMSEQPKGVRGVPVSLVPGSGSTGSADADEEQSLYEAVGGEDTFRRLVSRFYAGVADDPVLRPLYPEQDLAPAADRLTMFLMQYWGGPRTYSEQRGHPRLRKRHAPFAIGTRERDAWLSHMLAALDSLQLPAEQHRAMADYLHTAAAMLQNRGD